MNKKNFDVYDPQKEIEKELLKKQEEYVEILKKRLQGKKLMVATPMYGGQCFGSYCNSCIQLSNLCARFGIPVVFKHLYNESLIQRARNYLVDEFYRSEATHLLFIDGDITFSAQDALILLSMCGEPIEENSNKRYDIIGAPYAKKDIAWEKVYDAVKEGLVDENPALLRNFTADFAFNPLLDGNSTFKLNEPVEVSEAGTGFLCISRNAIEQFRKKYPKQKYTPDHARSKDFSKGNIIYAIFDCVIDPDTNRYLSEDYMFCKYARNIGLSVWICPWMKLGHSGSYIFGGSIPDLAKLKSPLNISGISTHHVDKILK
jgi:hypothetical protein